ncbi:MAG: DnaB-like helicase C-terminal domain-containing protein [Dolichospermum sp.]
MARLYCLYSTPLLSCSKPNTGHPKPVESRQNKRPMLSDLRASGSLEQDADFVFLLYRDEYYNPETTDRGIGEVIVAKGRDSVTGTVRLLYDAPMTQFKNLTKSQY